MLYQARHRARCFLSSLIHIEILKVGCYCLIFTEEETETQRANDLSMVMEPLAKPGFKPSLFDSKACGYMVIGREACGERV